MTVDWWSSEMHYIDIFNLVENFVVEIIGLDQSRKVGIDSLPLMMISMVIDLNSFTDIEIYLDHITKDNLIGLISEVILGPFD